MEESTTIAKPPSILGHDVSRVFYGGVRSINLKRLFESRDAKVEHRDFLARFTDEKDLSHLDRARAAFVEWKTANEVAD